MLKGPLLMQFDNYFNVLLWSKQHCSTFIKYLRLETIITKINKK